MECEYTMFAGRAELVRTEISNDIAHGIQSFTFLKSVLRELQRMSANFLWKKKMNAWRWNFIWRPMAEGGLCIRKLSDVCNAASLKLIWRCITDSTVWAKWMKNQYRKGLSIWEAPTSPLDSGTWKIMTKSRKAGLKCRRKDIGNDTSTAQCEPWIPSIWLINLIPGNTYQDMSLEVRSLIHNNCWTLTIPLLAQWWSQILRVPINPDRENIWGMDCMEENQGTSVSVVPDRW